MNFQTKIKKRHSKNSTMSHMRHAAIPKAFSLLLSAQLICSGLALSTAASFDTSAARAAESEAAPAPSWNETKTDSMFVIDSKNSDAGLEAHTRPAKIEPAKEEAKTEAKPEVKADVKEEIKTEVKAVAKEETKTEAKAEVKTEAAVDVKVADTKTETRKETTSVVNTDTDKKNSTSVKSIAEVTPVTAIPVDSAVIMPGTPAATTSSTTTTTSSAAAAVEDQPTAANAVDVTITDSSTDSNGDATQTVVTDSNAKTMGAGSILSPDGQSLFTSGGASPKVGEGALTTVDSLSSDNMTELGATVVETGVNKDEVTALEGGVLIVDSDQVSEVEETVKYENLPTDEGKTRIKTGARFPVVVTSQISSKNAHKGDGLEARLKYDLKIGDRLVAKKGSAVQGHINYALPARSVMHSLVSPNRWYRNSGCLGVEFDEIVTEKGEHLPLVAAPAKNALIVKNKAEGRVLGVNHLGQIAGPWEQQLKYKAIRIGLNAALAPAGVFSFGAMPVALGLMGAANPSFAFMKPVGTNVRHRRIKGFAWGFLSGIPGSWLIEDTVVKGNEAIIKPGDEFLVEFHQEFTGEPASEAQMMPNANAKVHGDVRTSKKKAK